MILLLVLLLYLARACPPGAVVQNGECQKCSPGTFYQQQPDLSIQTEVATDRCYTDCQNNACGGDFVCFQREHGEPVPGCIVPENMTLSDQQDVCIQPTPNELTVSSYMYNIQCPWQSGENNVCTENVGFDDDLYCGGDGWVAGTGYIEFNQGMTSESACETKCSIALRDELIGQYDVGENFHVASYQPGQCRCHMLSLFNYCLNHLTPDTDYTILVIKTIVRHRLLNRCEGSCRSDSDCAGDLYCHMRSGNEYTPSCDNAPVDPGTSICYDPNINQFECTNCPVMTYQPLEGTSACLSCESGTFTATTGMTTCQACPDSGACCAGYGSVNNTCVECLVGTFSTGVSSACVECPHGHIPVVVKTHSHGKATYFGKNASNECYECPIGTQVENHRCVSCPVGTYALNHECPACPMGTYSDSLKSTQCTSCPHGFYANQQGSVTCNPCAQNYYTIVSGASACIQCPSGKKSPIASDQCYDACPANTFDNGVSCNYCEPGQYYSAGVCTECPDGYVKPLAYEPDCETCVQKVPSSDKTKCEACPEGSYFSAGECLACGQGTYGPTQPENVSLLYCDNCPSGYAQPNTGQTSCDICQSGTYSMTQISCTDCPLGKVAPYEGASVCQTCPTGTGANNSMECETCSAGKGSTNGQCLDCAIGKFSTSGTCIPCPVGRHASETGLELCSECPSGKYSMNTSHCGICNESAQEYTNLFGSGSTHCISCSDPSVACQVCGPGTYSSGNQCAACPQGYVNNGNRDCSACSSLLVPNAEQSDCVTCPPGQQKQTDTCVACPAGTFGSQSQCFDCPKGQFSAEESAESCIACPQGTTSSSSGSTLATDCQTCQDLGFGPTMVVIDNQCVDCLPGKVFSLDENNCVQCPNGQYRTSAQTECQACAAGKFSTQGAPCQECPTGYFNVDTGQSVCQLCLAECDECAAGYKRQNNECVACLPGSFSLVGQTTCQLCALGQYQPSSAAANCISCLPGQYQDTLGQATCKQCLKGFFQDQPTQGACHACPAGQYSDSLSSSECTYCPTGDYTAQSQSESVSDCIPCPKGTRAVSGTCVPCSEGYFQDLEGQTTCKSCALGLISESGAVAANQCFSLDGMVSYVFGMKPDSKPVQKYTKKCEIRPNSMLLCPGCTCDSDSRNGFWASPLCDECQRGFATRTCKVGCAGYNGVSDDTMCNGKGRCWYGKFGNGLCYCGGKSDLDASSESVVVDVRLCPKGQICPNYGDQEQSETMYMPVYYMILYRQYSTFVLKLSDYTPTRGHMWFKRYSPSAAYENGCEACTGTYQQNALTSIGYFSADGTYTYFKDAHQTKNGFHGENCQYECAACLHGGQCNNVPHPFRYTYTIVDSYRPQRSVTIPTTYCKCPGGMDPEHMCCPNGFQPYVFYGVRGSVPYSRFTKMPLITSVVNTRMDYFIRRDILLEPDKSIAYTGSQLQWQSKLNGDFIQRNFSDVGAYDSHPYFGTAKDICRACPGLFGKGVRSQSTLIESEKEAVDFWWDNAMGAASRKCNGVGVCDFYAKEREIDVHFMGNADSFFKERSSYVCNASQTVYTTYQDSENIPRSIINIQQCAQRSKEAGDEWFAYAESYFGGTAQDMDSKAWSHQFYAEQYATTVNSLAVAVLQNESTTWFALSPNVTSLPLPNTNSLYEIHVLASPKCIGFKTCDAFTLRPGYSTYKLIPGRGRDRPSTATYDRFDTCFTYNYDSKVSTLGLYTTKEYVQGEDPFLGGLCPPGHFCTSYEGIGYKEECPPGYYQPDEGRTRTRQDVKCSDRTHLVDGCQPKTSTLSEHDYVDKVCQRCPRNMWAPAGSAACQDCPVGRVKKVSGSFDPTTPMINMPTSVSRYTAWYYQENEQGKLTEDCALIPPSIVHVSEADSLMSYDRPSFLPVVTCPYGYSTQPGSHLQSSGDEFADMIKAKLPHSIIEAPFMQMELLYKRTNYGETCDIVNLNEIQSLQNCRSAADSLGIANVQQRIGLFEGCWYMPSVNPNTVFWGIAGIKKCLPSLQYICQAGNSLNSIWSDFVRSTCFRCPGTSVSGPESGTCGNCFGNNVREYAKEAIQRISENGIIPMEDVDENPIQIDYESIKNLRLQPLDQVYETPTTVLTPKFNVHLTLADCFLACQSLTMDLQAIGIKQDQCGCASATDVLTTKADSAWTWYNASVDDTWSIAQPLCTNCQPGQYLDGTCEDCPAGYYTASSVDSNTGACKKCQPGYFQVEKGSAQCDACPSGYYQILEAQGACFGCASGQYQSQQGMSFCNTCPLGYLQPLTGQFECTTCPAGFYMLDAQTMECLSCAPGQYQDVDGSSSCKACEPGRYSSDHGTSQSCSSCPLGTYQVLSGQTSCTACTWGTFKSTPGSNTICDDCPSGWYAKLVGQGYCEPCPGGYPCDQTHVSNSDEYFKCPSGTYLPPLTWGSTCTGCAAEQYANANATGCLPCPLGTTTNGLAEQDCRPCPEQGWNGISNWNGMEYQTQEWSEVVRFSSKPAYAPNEVGECKQVCDSNGDCEEGLKCFQRYQLEPVPGCSSSPPTSGQNVCYKQYESSKLSKNIGSGAQSYGECEGPCGTDADCDPGLHCHLRTTGEATPGCHGPVDYNINLCYDASGARKMSQGYQYASISAGSCVDSQYLPEGAFPPLLDSSRRLYDNDRVQECMNRCLDAYPGTKGFYIRVSDEACACSSGTCDQQSVDSTFQTFHIFETDIFVDTFSTYVVALTNGTRKISLFDADDSSRVSTWQSNLAVGSSQASAMSTVVVEQMWQEGQLGRMEIKCENHHDLYNCHFRISKDGGFPEFKFYKEDPVSNYCAMQI